MLDNLLAVAVDKEEMNKFQTKISWIFFSLSIYNVSKDSHWNKKKFIPQIGKLSIQFFNPFLIQLFLLKYPFFIL